jgi:hypothetical protein
MSDPTLVVVPANGNTPAHLQCVAEDACDCTVFEIHLFNDQLVEVVCSACGEIYTLSDLITMNTKFQGP